MSQLYTTNQIIKRSEIHDQYGGNRQSGISFSANHPYIFIFSGDVGHQHGYKDQWLSSTVFSYTGEGQIGDMQFTKGNLEIIKQRQTGKRLFLFTYLQKGIVKFEGELEYDDFGYFTGPDREGNNRIAINFFLKRPSLSPDHIVNESPVAYIPQLPNQGFNDAPNETERAGLIISRVGQGAYRKSILYRWGHKCAVTGYSHSSILIASHIVPWKDSTNFERHDVNNGILLSPVYDALFDQYLISFENNGKIILSRLLINTDYHSIGITGKEVIENFHSSNHSYLEKHRAFLI